MSWFSNLFGSPNPLDDRSNERDRARSAKRDRREEKEDRYDRDRDRRDRKERRDRDRDLERGRDRDRDRGRGRRNDSESDRSDSDSDSGNAAQRERERARKEKERRRREEEEEDLARRDKLPEKERERLERLDRERERERRLRYPDEDEEKDRQARAEKERQRKADEDAREALKAEDALIQIQDNVPAPDAFNEDDGSNQQVEPKKVNPQYVGDLDPKMNNDAVHMIWSGIKCAVFGAFFFVAISQNTTKFDTKPCTTSTEVPWCVNGNPSLFTSPDVRVLCYDATDTTHCDCATAGLPSSEALTQGCFKKYYSTDPTVPTPHCQYGADFEAGCNDYTRCDPKYVDNTQKGYLPGMILFFFMALWEAMHAGSLFMWTAVHPDKVQEEKQKTCAMRILMMCIKSYPYLSQVLAFVTALCWIFLYLSYEAGYKYCAHITTQLGTAIPLFPNTKNFLAAYVVMLVVVIFIGTILRKKKPIRGEFYIPSMDGELTAPLGCDCKDMRERPWPRLCPDLWETCDDPDSRVMCQPCGTPCKYFWNFLFSLIIVPLGWTIEMFFRHRHFIGP